MVLISLNFNYELLSERASRIGHQSSNQKANQKATYDQMIVVIEQHMKMNR